MAKPRLDWRKLHLGVDTITGEILAHTLTPSETHDSTGPPGLLAQVEGPIFAAYGDRAYDAFAIHRAILSREAISPRPRHDVRQSRATRRAIDQTNRLAGHRAHQPARQGLTGVSVPEGSGPLLDS